MKYTAFSALALIATTTAGLAGPFDGTYRQTLDADCTAVAQDGGALRIDDGIFYGVDVQCRMTRPVNVVDMDATLYTMRCSGDDTNWTERTMVMTKAEGGILMVWNGYAFAYEQCTPKDLAAPEVEPTSDTANN